VTAIRHNGRVPVRRVRRSVSGAALALYGGTAWIACLLLGIVIPMAIRWDERPEGVVNGATRGTAPRLHEVYGTTIFLLLIAYGVFF
jgi:hypothetical protein